MRFKQFLGDKVPEADSLEDMITLFFYHRKVAFKGHSYIIDSDSIDDTCFTVFEDDDNLIEFYWDIKNDVDKINVRRVYPEHIKRTRIDADFVRPTACKLLFHIDVYGDKDAALTWLLRSYRNIDNRAYIQYIINTFRQVGNDYPELAAVEKSIKAGK